MKQFAYRVEKVWGDCACGYRGGDVFCCQGMNTPGKPFHGAAFMALFPMQAALYFGAEFCFEDSPKVKAKLACPDNGNVVFRVALLDSE